MYQILYFLHTTNRAALNDIMATLTPAGKKDNGIKHGLGGEEVENGCAPVPQEAIIMLGVSALLNHPAQDPTLQVQEKSSHLVHGCVLSCISPSWTCDQPWPSATIMTGVEWREDVEFIYIRVDVIYCGVLDILLAVLSMTCE